MHIFSAAVLPIGYLLVKKIFHPSEGELGGEVDLENVFFDLREVVI
jgi:hypothetical protein